MLSIFTKSSSFNMAFTDRTRNICDVLIFQFLVKWLYRNSVLHIVRHWIPQECTKYFHGLVWVYLLACATMSSWDCKNCKKFKKIVTYIVALIFKSFMPVTRTIAISMIAISMILKVYQTIFEKSRKLKMSYYHPQKDAGR